MEKYIYTAKNGIHIINLEDTFNNLQSSYNFLFDVAKKGGKIIFIGTKKQSKEIIENEAKRCGAFYVTDRWLGGTMTNLEVIRKSIKKFVDLKKGRENGDFEKYTKKERLLIDKKIEKLEKKVGGLVGLNAIPNALFIVDPKREKTAVKEAKYLGVKIVSLIDTNSDVREIDYPIPGNDDAIKSVALLVKVIADSIELGYKEYEKILVTDKKSLDKKVLSTEISNTLNSKELPIDNQKLPIDSNELLIDNKELISNKDTNFIDTKSDTLESKSKVKLDNKDTKKVPLKSINNKHSSKNKLGDKFKKSR